MSEDDLSARRKRREWLKKDMAPKSESQISKVLREQRIVSQNLLDILMPNPRYPLPTLEDENAPDPDAA
jgi:hypothetical protein